MTFWAGVLLVIFIALGGFRGLIAWCLLVLVVSMAGCSTTGTTGYDIDDKGNQYYEALARDCRRAGGVVQVPRTGTRIRKAPRGEDLLRAQCVRRP